jgi:hypothetical protein
MHLIRQQTCNRSNSTIAEMSISLGNPLINQLDSIHSQQQSFLRISLPRTQTVPSTIVQGSSSEECGVLETCAKPAFSDANHEQGRQISVVDFMTGDSLVVFYCGAGRTYSNGESRVVFGLDQGIDGGIEQGLEVDSGESWLCGEVGGS